MAIVKNYQSTIFMVINMIIYNPFWETMKRCGKNTYQLINKYGISSATIDRIRKGKGISTQKVDDLCKIFQCNVEDIIKFVDDENS